MLKTIAKFTDTLINIAMGAIIDFANVEISKSTGRLICLINVKIQPIHKINKINHHNFIV